MDAAQVQIPGGAPQPGRKLTTSLPWLAGFAVAGLAVITIGMLIGVHAIDVPLDKGLPWLVFGIFGAGIALIDVAVMPRVIRTTAARMEEQTPPPAEEARSSADHVAVYRLFMAFGVLTVGIPSLIAIAVAFRMG